MNNFFKRLSLPVKLLLLTLFPLALIIYLSCELYNEKSKKAELLAGYIDRINIAGDFSDLINALQLERRHSFAYGLKKDIDSRAQLEAQRPATDLAIKKLEQRQDSTLKNFKEYTFLTNLENIRKAIDSGASQDVAMQYYTTTIFRLNTLNIIVPVGSNRYLKPVFADLISQKILSEMATYLGIIRANFYNVLYTKQNMAGTLYGLAGVNEIYKSYETEFLSKASTSSIEQYKKIRNTTALKPTVDYINKVFQKFSFDSLYNAEDWWKISREGTDQLKGLQQDLMRHITARMNKAYKDEIFSKELTLSLLITALVLVFVIMFYTTHVITQMLRGLNEAAQKIAKGSTNIELKKESEDVIGNLAKSISKIAAHNKQLAEAADAIGKGNFNTPFDPRNEDDVLSTAIIRMKDNLKRFTMEIEKSKEQFRQVADNAPVMIWMTDANKLCNFVNKSWLKFTGRSKEQELGYGWIEGMHPDDYSHCNEVFEDAFIERKGYSLEYRFKREDEEYRWLRETGAPRYSAEGKFEGFIGTCVDIHEMKMHEQLRDNFIKMASHELKTPVTSIKGYVQLLLSMYKDHTETKQPFSAQAIHTSLTTIDRQIVKLNRLMSELLDLSRIDSGKLELHMQNFDLYKIVAKTVDDIQPTTEHHINISNHANGKVLGDKDRIGQVVYSLLANAIKYSPKTNSIEVNIFRAAENSVSVSVADHGIGIEKKHHEKIFERFYRVEGKSEQTYPGFGIGLFIASEIIQRHKGKLSVESEKGQGSVFTFTLPISSEN
ncbi:MAG TPA: ATP-binding protein [Chitinophagaceae bacterium]|jgi:PAS domain S-box-containing protein|nr:ATP-binding protein [Chitinophagaceae bacterium]